jgi:hypothetical protein
MRASTGSQSCHEGPPPGLGYAKRVPGLEARRALSPTTTGLRVSAMLRWSPSSQSHHDGHDTKVPGPRRVLGNATWDGLSAGSQSSTRARRAHQHNGVHNGVRTSTRRRAERRAEWPAHQHSDEHTCVACTSTTAYTSTTAGELDEQDERKKASTTTRGRARAPAQRRAQRRARAQR